MYLVEDDVSSDDFAKAWRKPSFLKSNKLLCAANLQKSFISSILHERLTNDEKSDKVALLIKSE